ncbi:Protein of unknown function [Amycolatopsis arida]|uniref:DUF2867 domain-containing protein n=1 Tax=Amycolatopsis arida TaxID=587909 RepID=A0A1I5SNH1_9PSEU|nr:DUF2867 domain-containing protein [Amycolatopsis arida]TDX96410.1 uncharacterized protein DUF2867 [Amycolatopsis arida]SFP72344.1 Protein of unknown function [Amycolatopsis arida]
MTAPELERLLVGADHVDTKTVHTTVPLREFVAAALSWQPVWIRLLWRARAVLATALRLRETHVPEMQVRPEEIKFAPGSKVGFFTVLAAEEDRFLLLEAGDTHLVGYLAVVAEPAAERVHTTTVVRYRRWTGRLYFAIVRPFHHIVVRSMINAAVAPARRKV